MISKTFDGLNDCGFLTLSTFKVNWVSDCTIKDTVNEAVLVALFIQQTNVKPGIFLSNSP